MRLPFKKCTMSLTDCDETHEYWDCLSQDMQCHSLPVGHRCYDKHALRADAPIPRTFLSPLVLWRYSTYAWLIRTPSFHYDFTSCITPCLTLAIVLLTYDTLFLCSGYVSPLFTNTVRPLPYNVYKPMYLVESNPKFDLVCYRVV